jgi:Uma2 family endonuclease
MTISASTEQGPYLADLLKALGGISPDRVLLKPLPGTATEKDLLDYEDRTGRPCELVDGVLVEKDMGYREGSLAGWILHLIQCFLDQHDLGNLAAPDGPMRLWKGLVRLPDVSFVRWERLPDRELPEEAIPDLVPDLAIEVLSKRNTRGEMKRKLKEYFLAGTTLAWLVDPRKRIVTVHTAPDVSTRLTEDETIDGGAVLPGFSLPVKRIFARMASPGTEAGGKPRKKRP